jgi:hypothetical protein
MNIVAARGTRRGRPAGRTAGSSSNPAASRRTSNFPRASSFGVPVSVYQSRCSHSVAASSWRANPGSHATVARMAAISSALNARPL